MAIIKRKGNIKKLKIPVIIKRNIVFALLKKSIIPLIAICLVLFAYQGIKSIFVKSPYFEISKIDIMPETDLVNLDKSVILGSLKGKNIFTVDIENTARAIRANYPELKKVVVKRVMPDMLQVVIVPRIPVALIKAF
ncbi:MAG: FtsQ-type POTRA domain-containing protein, partial [Candidatus Omnitrophica bacterium]|nr:FtsQ-type POTRA domain-containing protein [Candidatus Omnitrophota bacterium]